MTYCAVHFPSNVCIIEKNCKTVTNVTQNIIMSFDSGIEGGVSFKQIGCSLNPEGSTCRIWPLLLKFCSPKHLELLDRTQMTNPLPDSDQGCV